MKKVLCSVGALAAVLFSAGGIAQDSVDVTFRYQAPAAYSAVGVPGEFNGWNSGAWPMVNRGGNLWTLTKRLRIGGNPTPPANGVAGAWQYKFYPAGTSGEWPNDPLNHHVNSADNSNTFLYTKDPTIYQFVPNQRSVQGTLNTPTPAIGVYLFPKVGAEIDTSTLRLQIDSVTYTGIGSSYDPVTRRLVFVPSRALPNGTHTVIVQAGSTLGGMNADTVTIATLAGTIQITSRGNYTTRNLSRTLYGAVTDTTIHVVKVVRNASDTTVASVTEGRYQVTDTLSEGKNVFRAVADSAGTILVSDPVTYTLAVSHAPVASIAVLGGGSVQLDARGSTDPDTGQSATLTYLWSEDPANPSALGISGLQSATASVPIPASAGEYYVGLIVADADGNRDTTRAGFTVSAEGAVTVPTIASHPSWARRARVYFLFPKAMSPEGTIAAARAHLQRIRDLGFSVIWMMPVMDNASPIDNGYGAGYDIVDFYTVAPEYGTNQDLKDFISQAHSLGMKVILDITPNHTSRQHPWCVDAHTFKQNSPYWSWYEHATITSNTNGLGDCLDEDGFNYYCGFSKELQNINWSDIDLRTEMINVFRYWIREFGADGFRFDVYWGPHRRYGEALMGKPVRDALKHIRPDILLLAEDDGTGYGTEVIYADHVAGGVNGGADAAYDFKTYFNAVRNFPFNSSAVTTLHSELDNGGYYPGPNALFMRFMESQDEDRIYSAVPNGINPPSSYYDALPATAFQKSMSMASVIFTAPGLPMVWNGQEVGWGYGIPGPKEARNRSVINWNFQGKSLLSPHYQKLAHIRAQFPAFTQHKQDTNGDGSVNAADSSDFIRVGTSEGTMYAFARPWPNQNGLAVVNFSGSAMTAFMNLAAGGALKFTGGIQPGSQYYVNDLLAGTQSAVSGSALSSFQVSLPPYGSAIYTVSTTPDTLKIENPVTAVRESPESPRQFTLDQNYPNPFNPSTTIRFSLPEAARVSLRVYDLLGREITVLAAGDCPPGVYSVVWNGRTGSGMTVGSGVYICRLAVTVPGGGERVFLRKMALVR